MTKSIALWLVVTMGFIAVTLAPAGCGWFTCAEDSTCRNEDWWRSQVSGGSGGSEGEGGTAGTGGTGGAGGAGGTDGDACPDDPADAMDGIVAPECGVWVSSVSGIDTNPGTQAEPKGTLAKAIKLAGESGIKRVYACGETYSEPVSLPAGVSLFGGFDCEKGWIYEGVAKRATIKPIKSDQVPLLLMDGNEESLIGDLHVVALNATMSGASSVAVFADDFAKAEIRRSELVAGNGMPGLDGEDGTHGFQAAAQKGLNGNDGNDACGRDIGLGGLSVVLQCDGVSISQSGYGGDGDIDAATGGGEGEPAPNPNDPGYGKGGEGEDPMQAIVCGQGFGGANGLDGANGEGASTYGKMTTDGAVIGAAGEDGLPGQPGQGGGGGGGALGSAQLCGGVPKGGAGGGSGGTGGCGGRAGKGGQAGGSSIGLLTRSADIVIASDVTVVLGNGGNGGNGGVLQLGGGGGLPGHGGKGVNGVKAGCAGGPGGKGGKGGNGGGGHGGHSVAYAYLAMNNPPEFHAEIVWGLPGEGGLGGNPAFPMSNGDHGLDHIPGVPLEP